MEIHEVLVRPVITEKSTLLQEKGKYVFQVYPEANKTWVKKAIESHFNVKVIDVNVITVPGKQKRFGTRLKRLPDTKKALVTLRPGDKIQIIEGI